MKLAVCLVSLLVCQAVAESARVSPVQKVIELLDELKAKVKRDFDAEAAAMAEYTEWCDSEVSEKGYAIKTATRQIGDFKASIEDSQATIAAKESEVAELGTQISAKEGELVEATTNRNGESADFKAEEKELMDSVDELAGAIVQIKRGAALVQVQKRLQPFATALSKILEASRVNELRKRQLGSFLQSQEDDGLSLKTPQGSVDVGGGGHSEGIMTTLNDMKTKAEDQLSAARKADMEAAHNYSMLKMSLEQEVKNLKGQLADATSLKASTGEELAKAQGELAEVEKSKAADEEYKQNTEMACSSKAQEWAQRQEQAAGETAAIEKAKQILAEGVTAFVQERSTIRVVDDDDDVAARRQKLGKFLKGMASQYNSFALMQMANMAKADPFAKIKGLISQMIEKLLNEANEEAQQKAFCDKEIGASKKSQQDKTMKLDKTSSRLDVASSTVAEVTESIKVLEGEIAEIDEKEAEATKIRSEENADYLKSSKDFKDSAEAVSAALEVLKTYYEGGALIQVHAHTTLQSKSRQPDFGGKSSDVGGTIISVLEVAEDDFTRMLAEAETDEESSANAFAKLQQESKVARAAKQAEIKAKRSEIKSLQMNIANYREDKQAVGEELDAVMAYLEKLKPECEVKVMSYEEKVARREAEIDGLKQALAILEGEDIPALVQTGKFLQRK